MRVTIRTRRSRDGPVEVRDGFLFENYAQEGTGPESLQAHRRTALCDANWPVRLVVPPSIHGSSTRSRSCSPGMVPCVMIAQPSHPACNWRNDAMRRGVVCLGLPAHAPRLDDKVGAGGHRASLARIRRDECRIAACVGLHFLLSLCMHGVDCGVSLFRMVIFTMNTWTSGWRLSPGGMTAPI